MYHILIKYKPKQTGPDTSSTDEQRIRNVETYNGLLCKLEEIDETFLDQIVIDRT